MVRQECRTIESLREANDNVVLADPNVTKANSLVEFSGTGNVLRLSGGVHLDGVRLRFFGNGSVMHICAPPRPFRADVSVWHS